MSASTTTPPERRLAHSHQRLARGHARLTEALARRDAGRFQQALAAFKRHFVAHQILAAVDLYAALRQLGRDDPQALHQACEARREMHRVARLVLLFAEMHLQPPPQGLDLSTASEHTQHLGRVLSGRIRREQRDVQRLVAGRPPGAVGAQAQAANANASEPSAKPANISADTRLSPRRSAGVR